MNGKQVKRAKRKESHERLRAISWLAQRCYPEDLTKQLEIAQRLWGYTDEQLATFTGNLLNVQAFLAEKSLLKQCLPHWSIGETHDAVLLS